MLQMRMTKQTYKKPRHGPIYTNSHKKQRAFQPKATMNGVHNSLLSAPSGYSALFIENDNQMKLHTPQQIDTFLFLPPLAWVALGQ